MLQIEFYNPEIFELITSIGPGPKMLCTVPHTLLFLFPSPLGLLLLPPLSTAPGAGSLAPEIYHQGFLGKAFCRNNSELQVTFSQRKSWNFGGTMFVRCSGSPAPPPLSAVAPPPPSVAVGHRRRGNSTPPVHNLSITGG